MRDLLRAAAERIGGDAEGWARFVRGLPAPVRRAIAEEFFAWAAHGGQCEPAGEWRTWLLMAGRGFGKTRAGAEWIAARAREHPGAQIALVAASRDEAIKVMVEGPSGLLATARTGDDVRWTPTRGTLRFASGAEAFVYGAAAGERLRGPQHHFAWADELAKWRKADIAWDNLQMGLRLGTRPRAIVTTTPKSCALLRRIRAAPGTAETKGRTAENVHLAEEVRDWLAATYGGTRLGRQELDGELLLEADGALWPRDLIERCRANRIAPAGAAARETLRCIVVGVDPPGSAGGTCGIVVCGMDGDGLIYVLDDRSAGGLRPEGWARIVAGAAEAWGADLVVAEKNNGGDMVASVLSGAAAMLPVRLVSASQGKSARAAPVAMRFEAGRAHFAGHFPALEDELAGLMLGGGYDAPGGSPDRADAMVWAMTQLMTLPPPRAEPRIRLL